MWVLRVPIPQQLLYTKTNTLFLLCCDRIISSSTSFPRKRCFAGFGAIIWLFQSLCGTAYPTHKHMICVCLLCFVFIWALVNWYDPFTKILSIVPHALGHYYNWASAIGVTMKGSYICLKRTTAKYTKSMHIILEVLFHCCVHLSDCGVDYYLRVLQQCIKVTY